MVVLVGAALLATRLRFERALRGSGQVEKWFEEDPEDFTRVFRAYHAAVPRNCRRCTGNPHPATKEVWCQSYPIFGVIDLDELLSDLELPDGVTVAGVVGAPLFAGSVVKKTLHLKP